MESTSISHLFESGVPPWILALLGREPKSLSDSLAFGHAHIQRPTGCWIKKGINNTSCRAIGIQWIQQARMDRLGIAISISLALALLIDQTESIQ